MGHNNNGISRPAQPEVATKKKSEPTYFRGEPQILESCIFPYMGLILPSAAAKESMRYAAIYEVLRRLPDGPFRRLEAKIDEFQWFIPHVEVRAMVQPFFMNYPAEEPAKDRLTLRPYAKVLYLNPTLERAAWDVTVAIVAHELAHIILDHAVTMVKPQAYDSQESEVREALRRWGFEREAKKHDALCKWRSTRELRSIAKLEAYYEEQHNASSQQLFEQAPSQTEL
jgi:hypothetical protein